MTRAMPANRPPLPVVSTATVITFLSPRLPQPRSSRAQRLLPALTLLAALFFSTFARGADCNALVLAQVQAMPRGGIYAANSQALSRLTSAVAVKNGALSVQAAGAAPNFCSEATYLIFLKTVAALGAQTKMNEGTLNALLVRAQPDGQGVWGRWNANGPGTARLFRELGLGQNFDDFTQARPGDFMKIFWSTEVGRRERGHSVIFLGLEQRDGVATVRFWSSNQPGGYGEKTVPRSKIAYAIFSRLQHPEALERLPALPPCDPYLARLNVRLSSISEARTLSGI